VRERNRERERESERERERERPCFPFRWIYDAPTQIAAGKGELGRQAGREPSLLM
jgi:hypothetical protein